MGELGFNASRIKEVADECRTSSAALVPNFEDMISTLNSVANASNSEAVRKQVANLNKLKESRVEPSAKLYGDLATILDEEAERLEKMENA